jgi:Mg-chelatase subunit ChlD
MTFNIPPDKPLKVAYSYHQFLVKELGGYEITVTPTDLLPELTSRDISVSFTVNSPFMITNSKVNNLGDGKIEEKGTNSFSTAADLDFSLMAQEILLSYDTASTGKAGNIQFHKDGEITYFLHTFAPGMEDLGDKALNKDIVFIVDCSGSMDSGNKMTQTKDAFNLIVDQLSNETDRFNIISFSDNPTLWKSELQAPNSTTVKNAKDYINGLIADGATNIIDSLDNGLEMFENNASRMKIIVFMTDGEPTAGSIQTSNGICSSIQGKNTEKVSIFSLGVGYDMDFEFLKKLSYVNYGRAYRIDKTDISEQIAHFYNTISTPLIHSLDLGYENAMNVYSRHAPYMFEGQEHCVLGKVSDAGKKVTFSGTGVTVDDDTEFSGEFTPTVDDNPFVSQLWAFMHIKWCEEKMLIDDENRDIYKEELIQTALEFQIVTDYTTMIVVAEKEFEEEPEEPASVEKEEDDQTYDSGNTGSGSTNNYKPPRQSSKFDDDDSSDENDYPSDGEDSTEASPVSITVLFFALTIVVSILYFRRRN